MNYPLVLAAAAILSLSACEKPVNNPAPVVAAPETTAVPLPVPGPAGEPGKPGMDGAPGTPGTPDQPAAAAPVPPPADAAATPAITPPPTETK